MLDELRDQFCQAFNAFLESDNEDATIKPFLLSTYEYCRQRHLNDITSLSAVEETMIKNDLVKVLHKFERDGALWRFAHQLTEKDLFEYLKCRSAVQFLMDQFSKYIRKEENEWKKDKISLGENGFKPKEYFLSYIFDDYFPDPYPPGPVPKHDGVPETHFWWTEIEKIYEQ